VREKDKKKGEKCLRKGSSESTILHGGGTLTDNPEFYLINLCSLLPLWLFIGPLSGRPFGTSDSTILAVVLVLAIGIAIVVKRVTLRVLVLAAEVAG
jgi:hypothetical protein